MKIIKRLTYIVIQKTFTTDRSYTDRLAINVHYLKSVVDIIRHRYGFYSSRTENVGNTLAYEPQPSDNHV